jgi:hypothetical protein
MRFIRTTLVPELCAVNSLKKLSAFSVQLSARIPDSGASREARSLKKLSAFSYQLSARNPDSGSGSDSLTADR